MSESFISLDYFPPMQSLSFAIRKTFAAKREIPKQPRDCMQRSHVIATAAIVTSALRAQRHLDRSHRVGDGGR
jgi:hypothetical protein